jgi:HD superfamily phosphodiesterase
MMRTPTGRELAEKRDQFMREFVHQIQEEYLMNA